MFRMLALLSALALPLYVQAQAEPIRIGFLTVRTGPLAAGGKQMEQGIQLFLKERNNRIAGRKVELIIADTGGNPAGARTKTQELVERNKVHVVIGPLAAFEGLAIDDYVRQTRTPTVSCSAAAEDLTQRKPNPWFVRTVGSSAQSNHALGEYAAKTLGYKRVAIIADDFAYGHETAAGFQRVFEDSGGKVVQRLLTPLNAPDYGSHIAQLKRDVDAVYAGFGGANGFRFLRPDREYVMKALRNPGTVRDPRGEWHLDEYGNPVMPIYMRKVERRGGKLVNAVVKTYPNVSQFWTYDPKQFLVNPVYSREFPPAKNLEP